MLSNRSRAGVMAVLLAATTTAACSGGDPQRDTGHPSDSTTFPGQLGGSEQSEDAGSQPLVLVTRVDRPRLRLTTESAEALLAGDHPRLRAVHARGTQRVEGHTVADHPAVLRRVRRNPDLVGVVPAGSVDATVRAVVVDGVHPLRRPADYPLQVVGEEPETVTRVTVVGDVMLARRVPDPQQALAPSARRLARADITVGTLESTLSDRGRPQQGGDSFAASPDVVPLLADAGFDALSLANNHVGDYEVPAMLRTVQLLRRGGIEPFGAGRDLQAASRAAVVEQDGMRFAFLGFNAIGETPRATPDQPGALSVRMPPRTGPLVEADLRRVERLVRRLARRVDAVVVLPHWGTQYTHVAEPIQHRVARRLSSAGADLVVGGHPHWVQGLDHVGDTLVVHSLGNFVFDMDFMTQTQQGVVLETVWWDGELKGFELVPYRMDAGFAPRWARGAEGEQILADVWSHSHGPFRRR